MKRSCATCKHLGNRPPEPIKGTLERPDGYACGVLYVVTQHRYLTPYWPGDIVTWSQLQSYQIEAEPLVIIDPERTDTDSAGAVVREGVEPFACRAWNVEEREMPNRWAPIVKYDVRWDAFKGRYVRRKEAA